MNTAKGNENIGANEFSLLSHNKPMRITNIISWPMLRIYLRHNPIKYNHKYLLINTNIIIDNIFTYSKFRKINIFLKYMFTGKTCSHYYRVITNSSS